MIMVISSWSFSPFIYGANAVGELRTQVGLTDTKHPTKLRLRYLATFEVEFPVPRRWSDQGKRGRTPRSGG